MAALVSEKGWWGYSRGLREDFVRVPGGGLVDDPPDDPVLAEAVPQLARRTVGF